MEFFTTDYIIREMELPPEIQNLLNSPQLKLVKENLYKGYASEPGRIEYMLIFHSMWILIPAAVSAYSFSHIYQIK